MSLPPGINYFLPSNTEVFGPKLPWNVAEYRQEYKPMFMEIVVTDQSLTITAYEFAHNVSGVLQYVDAVDFLTVKKLQPVYVE